MCAGTRSAVRGCENGVAARGSPGGGVQFTRGWEHVRVSDHSAAERPKVSGINHVTFDVASVEESVEFYRDVLGCELVAHWRAGAYLTAGTTWIALVRRGEPPSPATDYSHIAFGVSREQFTGLTDGIRASGARVAGELDARTEPSEGLVIVDEL